MMYYCDDSLILVFRISWRLGYISKKEKPEDIHSFISITSYHHCYICFWIRCESPKYNSRIVDECVIHSLLFTCTQFDRFRIIFNKLADIVDQIKVLFV